MAVSVARQVGYDVTEGQVKAAVRDYEKLRERFEGTNGQAPERQEQGGGESHSHGPDERDSGSVDLDEQGRVAWLNIQPDTPAPEVDLDEMLAWMDKTAALLNARDPVRLVGEIRISTTKPVGIRFFSCLHLGGRYTNHAEGMRLLREVLDVENCYLVSLGDDIEGFLPGFPSAEAVMDETGLSVQRAVFEQVLDELVQGRRLLWGHAGQHSGDWFLRHWGYNPIKAAYLALGCHYFDGMAYIKLRVGTQVYFVASSHKFPGTSMYNPLHAMSRAVRWHFPMADVCVMGDRHTGSLGQMDFYPFEEMIGNRASSTVHLVQVGTAKTGPDKYTTKLFPPGLLLWPVLVFDPREHCIHTAVTLEDARGWLEEKEVVS
jgi:hypothetical protein